MVISFASIFHQSTRNLTSAAAAFASDTVTFLVSVTSSSVVAVPLSIVRTNFLTASILVSLAVFSSYNSFHFNSPGTTPVSSLPSIANALPVAAT